MKDNYLYLSFSFHYPHKIDKREEFWFKIEDRKCWNNVIKSTKICT